MELKKMTLIEHFEELRKMLIRCFAAVAICAVPCGIFWRYLFHWIAVWPLRFCDPVPRLIFTAPADAVSFIFEIALFCGTAAAFPFLAFQVWRFVAPGLYKNEIAAVLPASAASFFCFIAGASFCYFSLPLFLRFLIGIADGLIDPLLRVDEYFSFLLRMCLVFGLAFELPVASFVLTKSGIADYCFLKRSFRRAAAAIFIAGAVLTPTTDALSLMFFCLPLIMLYGISIEVSYLAGKSRRKLWKEESDE